MADNRLITDDIVDQIFRSPNIKDEIYDFYQKEVLEIDGTTHIAFKIIIRKQHARRSYHDPDDSRREILIVNAAEHPEALFQKKGEYPRSLYQQYKSWSINK